ncbi:MAG: carbohydrate kinase family protein [Candidatus Thorarchaeota archaeon]
MSVEIASIGRINMDIIMEVEKFPVVNGHVISKESHFSFGGSAANFATQASRLGVKTGLISCVGDDIYGQIALKNLSDRGVNTESILVLENQPTGLFFMAQDPKLASMVFSEPGANRFLEKYIFDEEYLSRTNTIHIAGGFPMMTERAIDIATSNGIIFSFDPGRSGGSIDFSKYLRQTDLLFVNKDELKEYFDVLPKEKDLRSFAKTFPGILVVKLGKEGAIATDGFEYCTSQIFEVEVADTLGAGDAFAAGFVTAWTHSEKIEQALHFANAVAAIAIRKKGAQVGQPNLMDTTKLLRKYGISVHDIQRTFTRKSR